MNYKKHIYTLPLIAAILLVPLHIQVTPTTNQEADTRPTLTEHLPQLTLQGSIAYAGCGLSCQAKKVIKKIWKRFLGGAGGAMAPSFGGIIVKSMMCHNGNIVFLIAPVAGGVGPYGVYPFSGSLYREYSVVSGHWALGNSPSPGACLICVPPVCISFPVTQSLFPGMGTS